MTSDEFSTTHDRKRNIDRSKNRLQGMERCANLCRAGMGNFEMCGINDLFQYENIGCLQRNFTHKIVI
jgi:hypothetical protein